MGRHLGPGHVYNQIPFEAPSDLETENVKEHIAGSHARLIETSAWWVLNHTCIPDTHPQDQLQLNQIIKYMLLHSI